MPRSTTRCLLLGALAAVLAVACSGPGGSTGPSKATDPTLVRVSGGLLMGRVTNGVRTFLGIPYAAPPVGPRRWQAPQPAAPWTGTRDAFAAGSRCPQTSLLPGSGSTNEDCLYLNVWTPQPAASRLPVMVWIHGGAFTGGAGSDYDAGLLVKAGGVIVVTINYRLGPLGLLDLPALTSEAADHSAGMYWLQDQQAALGWVRSNIGAFGGDARNVTIFGESAGGQSVCYNLASPESAGLFQRAITESGPCLDPTQAPAAAQATGARFAQQVGCADPTTLLACLRALPVGTLLGAQVAGPTVIEPWTPNVDGVELKAQPIDALRSGAFNHVPVIEGTNHDEYRLFVALFYDIRGNPVTATQYTGTIQTVFAGRAQQVLDLYPLSSFQSPSMALSTVITDSFFSCPARTADQALAGTVPTYAYEFSDPNAPPLIPDLVMPMGASHASELGYVFQRSGSALTAAQRGLSDQMMAYWTSFAKTGTPSARGAAAWPRYTASGDQFLELAPGGPKVATTFTQDHHCTFWMP